MKTTLLTLFLCVACLTAKAQTAKELIGKWQLVRYLHNGQEKDIKDFFKTDQVYQVFYENGKFESLIGDEVHKGKWKMSKDNQYLTLTSTLIPVKLHIDLFKDGKRITSYESLWTFEHKKIND